MKRFVVIAFMIVLALTAFTGCSTGPRKETQQENVTKANEIKKAPEKAVEEAAPHGDETPSQRVNIALYFLSKDKTKLVTQVRQVFVPKNQTIAEAAIQELIKGPQSQDLYPTIPQGTTLLKLGQSENIATVNFNSKFKTAKGIDELIARVSVVNTLTELENIKYVSIFVNDQELGFQGTPYGPMTKFTGDINSLWADLQQKKEQDKKDVQNNDTNVVENKDFTLYFQDPTARYLLPEVRNVQVVGKQYTKAIINELIKGPKDGDKMPPLPQKLVLIDNPKTEIDENGKKSITLNFSQQLKDYIQGGSTSETLALGSIVNSITEFIPDVDYVRILINGKSIDGITGHLAAPEGKLRRTDFQRIIGKRILIYFSNKDASGLIPVYRAVYVNNVKFAQMTLEELIRGPYSQENPDARPVIPQGITPEDIKGISIEGDLIKLNLSSNFFNRCKGIGSASESMTIFAIVNSLTGYSNIKRVQFFIEGKTVETLSGHIDISAPLMKNPGIIINK